MNNEHLVSIVERLKILAMELESELKSDVGNYVMSEDNYAEILKYVETNDL